MSKSYKNKLSPIKEPISVTFERLNPLKILGKKSRYIPGHPYPNKDGHGNKSKIPLARRSRKRRRKKKKRKTRKVKPVYVVPESGKRKSRKRKKKKRKKKKRKSKKNLAGATCNRFSDDCRGCLNLRIPPAYVPWNRSLGLRTLTHSDKTCLYNLDTGKCRQPNPAYGRKHGRNDWTRNVEHCRIPVADGDDVVEFHIPEEPVWEENNHTPIAYPIIRGDEEDDLPTAQAEWAGIIEGSESPGRRRGVCDSVTENCAIMGGKTKRKRRKSSKTKKRRRR